MLKAGRCLMCMKGISATANICPWCHTTTSYGKRCIATRTLHAKLNKIAVWFAVVVMRNVAPKKMARKKTLTKNVAMKGPVTLAAPTAG
jgi:hypothetical protein